MIELRWTEVAASDLESIRDYIRRDSPAIAQLVATRLFDAVSMLRDFPEAGRVVPERNDPALRELIRPPYRIVYERRAEAIIVLTVFHAARMFPADIVPPAR